MAAATTTDPLQNLDNKFIILDGGMGTLLENSFGQEIATPLWSAQTVRDNPQVIIDAHLAFLRAGASVILTATYQCSRLAFDNGGIGLEEGSDLMHRAISLAVRAKLQYIRECESSGITCPPVKIALSLGPLGAGLRPSQEYTGFYPPPYGPGAPHNTYSGPEKETLEKNALEHLLSFHYQRLVQYTNCAESWDSVDILVFETIPLLREAQAICQAMGKLGSSSVPLKPFWMSFVFPDGLFPEEMSTGRGIGHLFATVMRYPEHPRPSAIGINCTDIAYIQKLVHAVKGSAIPNNIQSQTWLLLYPNGGFKYDSSTQRWQNPSTNQQQKDCEWGVTMANIARRAAPEWAGVIVGGCCNCGPSHIEALSESLLKSDVPA